MVMGKIYFWEWYKCGIPITTNEVLKEYNRIKIKTIRKNKY